MYARSTTLRGDPRALDGGIAYVRDEILPALRELDGCLGLSLLCDRDFGRCILTTSWTTEDALHASAEAVRALRDHAGRLVGDTSPDVQDWEIAVMHRLRGATDGARTRVVWSAGAAARIDDNLGTFRTAVLPRIEELPGFCSVSLLVDRHRGRSALAVTHAEGQDLDRATGPGIALQQEFYAASGERMTDVADFDLVLAHLRVPETA